MMFRVVPTAHLQCVSLIDQIIRCETHPHCHGAKADILTLLSDICFSDDGIIVLSIVIVLNRRNLP